MKVLSAEEYLKKVTDTRNKLTTEKLSKYNDFKEKFVKEFNKSAEEAAGLLNEEFEVEYKCKRGAELYINMFCHEIKDDYEKIEMYYEDDEESEYQRNKSKKNSDYIGSFIIVFGLEKGKEKEKEKET